MRAPKKFDCERKERRAIYVTYFGYPSAKSPMRLIYLTKSADGGAHFSEPQLLITGVGLPGIPGNLKVAVDQATNQIYLTYQDYDDGNGEVRLASSRCGRSLRRPRQNDGEDGSSGSVLPVRLSRTQRSRLCLLPGQGLTAGGTRSVIFTTCGFSTDHALSFTNQQVTTVPFDASNNNFIGDYNWQASTNDAVYPIFVGDGVPGGDSNTQEVFVAHVTP